MAAHPDITPDTASAPADSEPWPSPFVAWYAIFVFALALGMNFLDRGIVGLLVQPLKQDLNLTDTEVGLIAGFGYIVLYALIALPIARFADRGTRRTIVGVGIAVWSLATAACGLALNFWQLFLARMGVGAGEAANGPPVFSMISDLFPRDKLPLAIAVLNFGFIFGTGFAGIFGGTVIHLLEGVTVTAPVVGTLKTWQLVFIAVGLPGLLVAALMFTVKEPKRRGRIASAGGHQNIPVREVVRFFARNARTYLPMFLGLAFNIIPAVGLLFWGAEYFRRSFGWAPADFAITSGIIIMVVGPFGLIFGGWLAGWLQRKGRDDANLRVVVYSFSLNLIALLAFTLAPNAWFALGAFAVVQFVAMWVPGPFNAALQVVTPNEMRGQITALFLFVFNVVGFFFGPYVVPWVAETLLQDPMQIGNALALTIGVLMPLSILSIWLGMKPYAAALAHARKSWG
jgi:MFS family permease